MNLTHKKYEVIEVEYDDLGELIEKTYGHEYSVPDREDIGNESYKMYNIDGEVSEYQEDSLKKFIDTGEGNYRTRHIMNDMCRKGIIEKGKYLIEIDW